jgi:O-antigen ligase
MSIHTLVPYSLLVKAISERAEKALPIFAAAYVASLPWTWLLRSEFAGRIGTFWLISITVVLIVLGAIVGFPKIKSCAITPRSILLCPWTWAVAVLIWSIFSLLWSLEPEFSLSRFLQLTSLVAATWAVSLLRVSALIKLLGVLAVSAAGVAALFVSQTGSGVRPWLGSMDPNTASFALLIGYVAALTIWAISSRRGVQVLSLALSAVLVSGTVVAASRSALLGLVALYSVLTVAVLLKKIRFRIFVIPLVIALVTITGTILIAGTIEDNSTVSNEGNASVFDRSFDLSDPTVANMNGRTQVWELYFERSGDWAFKGYGLGIQGANVPEAEFMALDPHSVPLQVGVQLGLVGLTLWTIMALLFLRASFQCPIGRPAFFMWIAVLPLALTTATADLAIFWVPFALAGHCISRGSGKEFRELGQDLPNIH